MKTSFVLFQMPLLMALFGQVHASNEFTPFQYSHWFNENVTIAGPYRAKDADDKKKKWHGSKDYGDQATIENPCDIHQGIMSNVRRSRWLAPKELPFPKYQAVFDERGDVVCDIRVVPPKKSYQGYSYIKTSALFREQGTANIFRYDFKNREVVQVWKRLSATDENPVYQDLVNRVVWGPRSARVMSYEEAIAGAETFSTPEFPAGCWRLPTEYGDLELSKAAEGACVLQAGDSKLNTYLKPKCGWSRDLLRDFRSMSQGARSIIPDMRWEYFYREFGRSEDQWDVSLKNTYWTHEFDYDSVFYDSYKKDLSQDFRGDHRSTKVGSVLFIKGCHYYRGEGGEDPLASAITNTCGRLRFARYVLKDACYPDP